MGYVTPEQIENAKEMDLYSYLQNYEPHELVRISGSTYTTKTHDSLKISNGKWMWWSRGIGGKTALDYLIKVRGVEFTKAVEIITGQTRYKAPTFHYSNTKPRNLNLILPQKNMNCDKVIAYLKSRGIDEDVIRHCISKGFLFESLPHHNAVFLGADDKGKPRYAALRGTGENRFIGDANGSDKNYSFRLVSGESDSVHLFESAIDLLSYATITKLKEGDYQQENLLSLAGVYMPQKVIENSKIPKALEKYLNENDSIKRVVFHLDNDFAGKLATKAIATVLPEKYQVKNVPPPFGKDFNDYLMIKLGLKKRERIDVR